MSAIEVNFDGIVGPTHNYAGLSQGNFASQAHRKLIASPKNAALQGLKKMKDLADLGFTQGVLPPHLRPYTPMLRSLGFTGAEHKMLASAWAEMPEITASLYSASPMWTANAATVSPFADTADGLTHFTPANLSSMFHRSFENEFTGKVLRSIFADEKSFVHHPALPGGLYFGDEGAANHTRLCASHADPGVELFVYGEKKFGTSSAKPELYLARQSLEASQAIARLHGLTEQRCVFAQQSPNVIDKGVFHNDVIAVGCTNLLFFHDYAFLHKNRVLAELEEKLDTVELHKIEVKNADIDVERAVKTYLFNTQLIDVSKNKNKADFIIVAPTECQQDGVVSAYLDSLVASSDPISHVYYFDLRESMKNGGGPACLRLRVVLTEQQIAGLGARAIMDDALYGDLVGWVNTHYRDTLSHDDLRDPALLDESRVAMEELSDILRLPNLYRY